MSDRFKAYEGSEPFAFVSYAHANSDVVYPIINRLNDMGFRLWYDEGIEISRKYKGVINEQIEKCSAFIVFVTSKGITRNEVIDECSYAITLNKKMVIVYLEPVQTETIDSSLRATFATRQCVMWYKLPEEERMSKLCSALEICRGEQKTETKAAEEKTAPSAESSGSVHAAASPLLSESVGKTGFTKKRKGIFALFSTLSFASLFVLGVLSFYVVFDSIFVSLYYGLMPITLIPGRSEYIYYIHFAICLLLMFMYPVFCSFYFSANKPLRTRSFSNIFFASLQLICNVLMFAFFIFYQSSIFPLSIDNSGSAHSVISWLIVWFLFNSLLPVVGLFADKISSKAVSVSVLVGTLTYFIVISLICVFYNNSLYFDATPTITILLILALKFPLPTAYSLLVVRNKTIKKGKADSVLITAVSVICLAALGFALYSAASPVNF